MQPKQTATSEAQRLILRLLGEGWKICWDRHDQDGHNCAAWKGGSVYRVHPRALQALTRKRLIVEANMGVGVYRYSKPSG